MVTSKKWRADWWLPRTEMDKERAGQSIAQSIRNNPGSLVVLELLCTD